MEGLPESVRARRRALGLSQGELAALAGVSERWIRALEQGKRTVRLDSLVAVLDGLGLELQLVPRGPRASE